MADRFGGKWLYGGGVLLSSVVSLLTPAAARLHIGVLIAIHVLSGLGESAMLPASYALIARWTAPQYHSVVATVIFSGANAGLISGTFMAGVLCDYEFAGGWPSAFYVFGLVGCVWSVVWYLLCYDSPAIHPRISAAERRYWETTIGTVDLTSHPPSPWRQFLTSVPVWALTIALFAASWGYFTLMICLPLYMHDVLGFDITSNGLFSALPFAISLFAGPASGVFIDWLRTRLPTTVVRKLVCAVAYGLIACFLMLVGYVGCNRVVDVAILCTITTCSAIGYAVVAVNQLDLAPLHAGKIMGVTATFGSLGAIAGLHAVGELTVERSTRSDWQNVFFLMSAVYIVATVVFVIFGSGERQSWAGDTSHDEVHHDLDRK